MANPAVSNGHLRISNELWQAWMLTGPLEERVFKAIVWECWGYSDRRDAKKPVPITRGRISALTGIKNLPMISRLTARLVDRNMVTRSTVARLETACYWPNQDYEQWVTSDQSYPSADLEPSTRSQSVPSTSAQSVTPTIQSGTSSLSSRQADPPAPPHFVPIARHYIRTFYPTGFPNTTRWRQQTNQAAIRLQEHPKYNEVVCAWLIDQWNVLRMPQWSVSHPDEIPGMALITKSLIEDALENDEWGLDAGQQAAGAWWEQNFGTKEEAE